MNTTFSIIVKGHEYKFQADILFFFSDPRRCTPAEVILREIKWNPEFPLPDWIANCHAAFSPTTAKQ
jgi:hypothetical protein